MSFLYSENFGKKKSPYEADVCQQNLAIKSFFMFQNLISIQLMLGNILNREHFDRNSDEMHETVKFAVQRNKKIYG